MTDFSEKNSLNLSKDLMNSLSYADLFKPGYYNSNLNQNLLNAIDLNTLINSNPYFLSTLESLKNISQSVNRNIPYNTNVKFILIKDKSLQL